MREERSITVRGQQLRIALDGPAGAPWLVLSNSLATDLRLWDRQVAALADRWRILRYDFRGHGGSAPSVDPLCDVNILASDLLGLIDALGAGRVHHVGVSMGAVAGVAAALQSPDRFAGLVVCNSRLRSTQGSAADLERRAQRARRDGMAALVELTLQKWFGNARLPLPVDVRELVTDMIANTKAADFAAYALGMASYQLEDRIAELPMPMHLLAGGDDGTIGDEFQALSARHPKIGCVLLEGAGHLPNLHVSTEFNSVLARLIG